MLFSKINMVDNQYKKHQNEHKEESDAWSNYWKILSVLFTNGTISKQRTFPFISEGLLFFTDDTVMTCAVAEAIMNGGQKDDFIDAMKKYGRMYPNADYGARFNVMAKQR